VSPTFWTSFTASTGLLRSASASCLKRSGKEVAIFHHRVTALLLDEIANDGIHILAKNLTIREQAFNRVSDAAQAFGPILVLASEITDLRSRRRIARF
jgi:hypothetical protein